MSDENEQEPGAGRTDAGGTSLLTSERRFEILVDAVTDYAIYMLDRNGIVTSWNSGAARAKGYAAAEIIGRHFSTFYTEEDRAAGLPERAIEAAAAQGRYESEGWRVRKDGSRFWVIAVIDAIRDPEGRVIGFAKVTRDITQRRELEQARLRLLRAQKMETLGQLTGGVAHDFNNLMTVISGTLSLILQLTSDERVKRLADTAQRAVARSARLTAQLLAYARQQALKPETTDLNEVIHAFEPLLRRALGERTHCVMRLADDLPLVDIDQAQFQSALLNLVVNARDAMEESGGTLEIETAPAALDAARAEAIGELPPGDYVVVTVRDSGAGMSAAVREKAIEPFFTTKGVGKGSGLGLSQVAGFARQSQGEIEIVSAEGDGTTVRIYVPVSGGAAAVAAKRGDAGDAAHAATVLVVEDDPDVLETAVETLKSFGYATVTAPSAPAALEILAREVPIDILFTDVIMPEGMSGIELAREAMRLRPELRVLLSSGYSNELAARGGTLAKVAFLPKPYRSPELIRMLRKVLAAPPAGGAPG